MLHCTCEEAVTTIRYPNCRMHDNNPVMTYLKSKKLNNAWLSSIFEHVQHSPINAAVFNHILKHASAPWKRATIDSWKSRATHTHAREFRFRKRPGTGAVERAPTAVQDVSDHALVLGLLAIHHVLSGPWKFRCHVVEKHLQAAVNAFFVAWNLCEPETSVEIRFTRKTPQKQDANLKQDFFGNAPNLRVSYQASSFLHFQLIQTR